MPVWWEHLVHVVTGRRHGHADLADLRDLPSRRVAVERTQYVVNDRERQSQDDRLYVLRLVRGARSTSQTVAVFSNGRNIGSLARSDAAMLAPLLQHFDGAAVVNGAGSRAGSIRLWLDLPEEQALRERIASESAA